ncbi:PLP-dependent transferase [Roseibium salinum]|nr:PLP-dependent transferase [Roseibium salinum]
MAGAVLGSFEAWLLLRGLRTLALRVERMNENAMALARHLEKHPEIEAVLYPGLASHPQHELAKSQMTGGLRLGFVGAFQRWQGRGPQVCRSP